MSHSTLLNVDALKHVDLPPPVASAIQRLADELTRSAGANLVGLILYGGLLRGRYRPGQSDVNVVVVLNDASCDRLADIAAALNAAWRSVRVEPFILTRSEVQIAAQAFPSKLLDIQAHHVVLLGEDPFVGLQVPHEHVRLGVEQALRNISLRLRRRFLSIIDDPPALASTLARIARPLAIELATLLTLAAKGPPHDDRTASIFATAAAAFDLDAEALALLAELRNRDHAVLELGPLYSRILTTVSRAADLTSQLPQRP